MCRHKTVRPITETAWEHKNANKHIYKTDKKSSIQNSRNNKVKEIFLRQKNCSWIY
jgi:hypothetical protein